LKKFAEQNGKGGVTSLGDEIRAQLAR